MSNVKALRERIKSVKSTQKITKAMRMVAASKLSKAKNSASFASRYRSKILDLFASIKQSGDLSSSGILSKAVLSKEATFKNTILVVYGSDRGLCGPYNANIFKKFRAEFSNYENPKVIVIGKKLQTIISKICEPDLLIPASIDPLEIASQVREFVKNELAIEPATQVLSYYTKFKNTLTLIPSSICLAPFDDSEINVADARPIDFEGDNLIEKLSEDYLDSNIVANLFESRASSEASCMTAMDSATRNAGTLIQKLTLKMNRTRQSIITNELIEVISGAEAI